MIKIIGMTEAPMIRRYVHRNATNCNLQELLDEFMESGYKWGEFISDDDTYAYALSKGQSLRSACKKSGYPLAVKFSGIDSKVYIMRTDL